MHTVRHMTILAASELHTSFLCSLCQESPGGTALWSPETAFSVIRKETWLLGDFLLAALMVVSVAYFLEGNVAVSCMFALYPRYIYPTSRTQCDSHYKKDLFVQSL